MGAAIGLVLLQSCVSEVAEEEIFFEDLDHGNRRSFEPPFEDDAGEVEEVEPIVWSPVSEDYAGLTYPVPSLAGLVELPVKIQGENLVHGDMILGTVDDLHLREAELEQAAHGGPVALSNPRSENPTPWPANEIPYAFASGIAEGDPRRATVAEAVALWNRQTQFLLRPQTELEERNESGGFVNFVGNDAGTCSAQAGYRGPFLPNEVSLAVGCSPSSIIHEVGHAVGLLHEQSRPDRDEFVTILWSNIQVGEEDNFELAGVGFGPYDFSSRMHYYNWAFTVDPRQPTILRKGCTSARPHECRVGGGSFTPGDTAGLRRIQDGASPLGRTRYLNAATGRCLRSSGDHLSPGQPLRQSGCVNGLSRQWYAGEVTTEGRETLVHQYSRLCVTRDHTTETLGACSSDPPNALVRRLVGPSIYQLEVNGWCLQASSGSNVRFEPCDRDSNQQWQAMD